MKKIIQFIVVFVITLQCSYGQGTFQPKTGDATLDNDLAEINKKAKQDMNRFKEDMKNIFGMGKERVEKIINTYKMEPADIVMASRIGKIVKKEPEEVCESFVKNRDKGWGAIAKEMGIKPGSPEFHELKNAGKNKGKNKGNGDGNGKGNGNNKEKGNNKGGGNGKSK